MNLIELYAFLKQIRSNEKGVTAMEYGVIAAAIIVAITTILTTMGNNLGTKFSRISSYLGS